jgi:hypothetical protein
MITDLPEEIAARTQQPPFEEVVTRVRADRQRTLRRVALGAAVLAAAAFLVLPQGGGGDPTDDHESKPGPSTPSPSDGLAMGVDEVLRGPLADVWAVGGSDDGGVAGLWQSCSDSGDSCGFAVLTDDGTTLGSVLVDSNVLSPTPDGWLIHTSGGWRLLSSDGWVSGVTTAGLDGVRPGDTAVETAGGLGLLRGDRLLLMPRASGSVIQAYVTPQGRLLEVTASGFGSDRLRASTDGRHWTTLRSWPPGTEASVLLAGRGRTVVIATLKDGPGGDLTLSQVELSHDGGRTWTTARGVDLSGGGVRNVSGIAVSEAGTAYLTTETDGLIRIDREGNAQVSRLSDVDRGVFTTTYQVCVLTGGGRQARLRCSEDDGTTWSGSPVPGADLVDR